MHSIHKKKKTQRKRRTVKGSLVDLESVLDHRGVYNRNWLFHARVKLKEREVGMSNSRVAKIKEAGLEGIGASEALLDITQTIDRSDFQRFVMDEIERPFQEMMHNLNVMLLDWDGVRFDCEHKAFRDYFAKSKNWFDQRKKTVQANVFWVPVIDLMKKFASKVAGKLESGDQMAKQCHEVVFYQMLTKLVEKQIKFPATRMQPLLSSWTIKNNYSMKKMLSHMLGGLPFETSTKADVARQRVIAALESTLKKKKEAYLIARKDNRESFVSPSPLQADDDFKFDFDDDTFGIGMPSPMNLPSSVGFEDFEDGFGYGPIRGQSVYAAETIFSRFD